MIKNQIFEINVYLFKLNKINNSKGYSICSNLSINILHQCHRRNSSVIVITFPYDITLHLGTFTVYSTCQMV